MFAKRFACGFLAALLLALFGGCQRSATTADKPSTLNPQPSTPPLSLHWLGINQVAADTNRSASFMLLWNLPETVKLKEQTLNKLAASFTTNFPSTLNPQLLTSSVRPLLDDLVQEEWFLQANPKSAGSNATPGFSLAIRLSDQRADLWQTNLSPLLNSSLTLSRSNGWTLLASSGFSSPSSALNTPHSSNAWLEADFDLNRLASAELKSLLTSPQTPALPLVSLTVSCEGDALRTRGQLTFDKALSLELEPWNVPTNLISGPFASFTAIRGLRPWLSNLKLWNDLQVGTPPNRIYAWALQALSPQTYFVAPQPNASNQVAKVTDRVLGATRPLSGANEIFKFKKSETTGGLEWKGIPTVLPFLKSMQAGDASFVLGGFFPEDGARGVFPSDLLNHLQEQSNLVAYDTEITGPRIAQWNQVCQFARLVTKRPQLPDNSASMAWLKALTPRLDNSVTAARQTAPNQLSFTRIARIGFTAIELHLLADWLESPSFPHGLHTFTAPCPEGQLSPP